MAIALGSQVACLEIADVFGLKHCRKLNILVEAHSIVTVSAECYVEEHQLEELIHIFKKYNLVERET